MDPWSEESIICWGGGRADRDKWWKSLSALCHNTPSLHNKLQNCFSSKYKVNIHVIRNLSQTISGFHQKRGCNKLVKRPVVVSCVTSVTRVASHAWCLQYMYARRAAGRKQPPVRLPLSSASWQQPVLTECTHCQIAFTFLRITSYPKDVWARNIQDGRLLQAKVTAEAENVVTNFLKREDNTSALLMKTMISRPSQILLIWM